jgi:protein-arginine kinase activator protein McsA
MNIIVNQDRDYKSIFTVDNLQRMLEKAIENEEYEIVSQLRDRINELKENQ